MTSGIWFGHRGRLGVAVLDRQQALNALTWEMVRALSAQLAAWREDESVAAVLVKAAPGRAFCAGGDILAATELVRSEGVKAAARFFHDEYRLNWRVHTFQKPYIALLDGITMGGGVGISVHGSYRVVTENTLLAMPETGIGFFPDVGGTWFLPRCPGEVGLWLGLTGARLTGADCLEAGIGTQAVAATNLGLLEAELAERLEHGSALEVVPAVLDEFRAELAGSTLPVMRARIDEAFGGADLDAVLDGLGADKSGFGAAQLAELRRKSPFAVRLTFAQLRCGRELSIEEALRLEFRMVHRVLPAHDFHEGVRALLIDKDRRPHWRHGGLDQVSAADIQACMAPLPGGELELDWNGI
jgi:enoyl-CoA hydratase